jgi:type IV pilus assembly protein PilW
VLARNVVLAVRAQYGAAARRRRHAPRSTSWVDGHAATSQTLDAASIARVRAVRVGHRRTRSPQREKPNATGQCEASPAKPRVFGEEIDPAETDWQCWRYRTSTVVIPLRNLVLGTRPAT